MRIFWHNSVWRKRNLLHTKETEFATVWAHVRKRPILLFIPNKWQSGDEVVVTDHPRSGVVYTFGRVCMSVYLSDDNFQKSGRRKFIFAHANYVPKWTCTEIVCPLCRMRLVPNWIYPTWQRNTQCTNRSRFDFFLFSSALCVNDVIDLHRSLCECTLNPALSLSAAEKCHE